MAGGQVIAFLAYARPEIETLVPMDANRDGTVSAEEFEAARPKLEELARQALELKSNGVVLSPMAVKASLGAVNDIEFPAGDKEVGSGIGARRAYRWTALRTQQDYSVHSA